MRFPPEDKTWDSAKVGDIFVLEDEVSLYTFDGFAKFLPRGEIVLCLGRPNKDEEMLYVTTSGVGGLPDDGTFYMYEAKKMC